MHVTGLLKGISYSLENKLLITFEINETRKALNELEPLKEKLLVVDAQKFRHKRSIRANSYFWVLCDKIAKSVGSDKDTIYLRELERYGVFTDFIVSEEALQGALPHLNGVFRYVSETERNKGFVELRGYFGESTYDSKEMADLITGTQNDAIDLGIDVLTPDEVKAMLSAWKGGRDEEADTERKNS